MIFRIKSKSGRIERGRNSKYEIRLWRGFGLFGFWSLIGRVVEECDAERLINDTVAQAEFDRHDSYRPGQVRYIKFLDGVRQP